MPNAVNRLKSNQLLKMEKENENKRKMKTMNKVVTFRSLSERSPGILKPETVWERLSKVKKCASNEGSILGATKSRTLVPTKSAHRIHASRGNAQRPSKKPLTPNTNLNRRVVEKKSMRRLKAPKSTILHDIAIEEYPFGCQCRKSVKEILTARSICNSKSSSDGSKDSAKKMIFPMINSNEFLDIPSPPPELDSVDIELEQQIESNDSLDNFVVAPLIPVPTNESLNMSANITTNFRCLLDEKNKDMEAEDISLIKNVVKTDQRHRQLHKDDSKLFKEILKTQLKEILRQESVVKSALDKLDVPFNSSSTIAMVSNAIAPDAIHKKPQVDVIFKNVPTLEKEIIILKALGEKLEATLKRTVSQNDFNISALNKMATAIANQWYLNWTMNEMYAECELVHVGYRRCIGIVREFRMVKKTIVELKEQASHHFYLPSNKDSTELKRTSFKRLKENPDLLMRYLKPKNSLVPFNVLDQDSVFFNSFLYNKGQTGNIESSTSNTTAKSSLKDGAVVREGGDSLTGTSYSYNYLREKEPLQIEEIRTSSEETLPSCDNPTDTQLQMSSTSLDAVAILGEAVGEMKMFEAPVRGKKRRRIRRRITPMQLDKRFEPKNSLFKTILVGSVQVSVFLLLIMAITYPDVKC